MKNKIAIILSTILFFASLFCLTGENSKKKKRISVSQIGSEIEIIGKLGIPIGQEVIITGKKEANGPIQNCFWVKEINGKKLNGVMGIKINGIANWQDGTTAKLQGHEIGTLAFLHLRHTNYGLNDSRWKGPHQTVFLQFSVTKIISPKNLKLERDL
jgi:hypothetical protein